MLILHTPETTFGEVTHLGRQRLAKALQVNADLVKVEWVNKPDGTGLTPAITVELPPMMPPSDVDPADPVAMGRWEAECSDLGGVRGFLKAKGHDEPEVVFKDVARWMVAELRHRLQAFGPGVGG